MTGNARRRGAWLFAALTAGLLLCECGAIDFIEHPKRVFGLGMAVLMLMVGARFARSVNRG